jgi:hypothetical protein
MLQWSDGVVAYLVNVATGVSSANLDCAFIDIANDKDYTLLPQVNLKANCGSMQGVQYICEKNHYEEDRGKDGQSAIHVVENPNNSFNVIHKLNTVQKKYIECPAGHLTHSFLSCDPKSACWNRVQGLASDVTCDAPLTPLPPMWTCRSGDSRVPYSLLCDHRADCSDHSDEQFCTFPLCQDTAFHCDEDQVRYDSGIFSSFLI